MKKIFKLFIILGLFTGMSACLDEEPVFNPDDVENVIEFYATSDVQVSLDEAVHPVFSQAFEVADVVEVPITIKYAGAHAAPQDIVVTFEVSETAVAEYNAWYNASTDPEDENLDEDVYDPLPAEFFELPQTVTIPAGKREATLLLKVMPENFDFSKSYALGLRIVETSYGIISSNFSTALFNVQAKNQWDGVYNVTGALVGHPSLSGPIDLEGHELVTTGASTVIMNTVFGSGGAAGLFAVVAQLTVNDDNSVTITTGPGSSATVINANPADDVWNPATQTFNLTLGWTTRSETLVMERTGPRD